MNNINSLTNVVDNLANKNVESQLITNEYLNLFCEAISDEALFYDYSFKQVYESKIIYNKPLLQSEVMKNLSYLSSDKKDGYLSFVIDKIKRTPYFGINKSTLMEVLVDYDVTLECFPKFNDPAIDTLLSMDDDDILTPEQYDEIFTANQQFYRFACKIEADIMLDFLESKLFSDCKTVTNFQHFDETENSNQLSVNQAIILLDKLGVFSTSVLENKPNTKKAKLISQLIGKNEKNVKTAIEKLELKPKDISLSYQRDLDKIQQLLDKLE